MVRSPRDQALKQAIDQHGGQLTALVRGLMRDKVEAEDVLQDVYEEYVAAYDIGLSIERLGAWLYTVARNKVMDRFRRKKTRADYEQALAQAEAGRVAEDEAGRGWLRDEIVQALALLPEEQRDVFIQYELEGKSFKEIAAATNIPPGTLMARKKYAVDFLRRYLTEVSHDYE